MNKLMLHTAKGKYFIDTKDIIRVEASSNYCRLFLSNGNTMVTAKLLRWFEEQLQKESFTRLHRSHLVNNHYLQPYMCIKKTVALQDGKIIPVSKRRKKMILQKLVAACFFFFFFALSAFSQNVGIGTNTPHNSAMLDVVSNSKGLGIPSMTTIQRNAIANPKAGLFVFDTNKQTLCMFNGTNWVFFQSTTEPDIIVPIEAVASDGQVGDEFGYSVDMSGNYAIIGAPYDDEGAVFNKGCAYIFFFNGTAWVEQAKLIASNGSAGDHFGFSVSISGDYAIVGAPDYDGAGSDRGSAYIFIRSGTNWTQQSILPAIGLQSDDNFGYSVSIDGNYCVVGSPNDDVGANINQGTAFFFVRSGVAWTQQDYRTLPSGAADDNFGRSVGIAGLYAVIGAPRDDVSGNNNAGSAHMFERVGTSWSHMQTLTRLLEDREFGLSVAVDSIYAAIGGHNDGMAYRFNGTTWAADVVLRLILGTNLESDDAYGRSVSVSGTFVIVGSPFHDGNSTSKGIANLYQTDGSSGWFFIRDIEDPLGGLAHSLGWSVAVSGFNSIAGAPGANGSKGKVLFVNVQ